jgi:hypothetical protein
MKPLEVLVLNSLDFTPRDTTMEVHHSGQISMGEHPMVLIVFLVKIRVVIWDLFD